MSVFIRRRSDYIIGFVTPAIGPNKSKKPTRLISPKHNIRGKVWMKNSIHDFTDNNLLPVKPCMLCSNFAACIVYRRYKPWEFLWFVWTDCWGDKSRYIITSPANWLSIYSVPIEVVCIVTRILIHASNLCVLRMKIVDPKDFGTLDDKSPLTFSKFWLLSTRWRDEFLN